jgi:hypothetical protein
MAYIYPAPGVADVQTTLTLSLANETDTGYSVPAMQDVTFNNANDVFTWEQLDVGSKLQVATTATNSLSMNIVVDQVAFFGETGASSAAAVKGIFGMSKDKDLVEFELYMGDTSEGTEGKTISAQGYITGLAPTVSATSPVWTSPLTITITGDFTVA